MMVNLTDEERATQQNETKIKQGIQKPSMSEEREVSFSHAQSPPLPPCPTLLTNSSSAARWG